MAGGFFFEQKTAYEMRISDWSSAVCSSDLQVELVLDELSSLQDNLMALDVVLNMQLRKDQAAHLGVLATEYETAFSEVVQVIAQRNSIVSSELNVLGPKVASDLEALKQTGLARQDAIGDAVTAQVSRSLAVGIAGTLAAVVLGLVLSVVVGRGIAKPILAMTAAMDHLAKGDKTTEIPAQGRTDEVGLMATAVQVF